MWRIIMSSKEQKTFLSDTAMYVPDSNIVQDIDDSDLAARRMSVANNNCDDPGNDTSHMTIKTEKVCPQELPMSEGVDVVHASPAAGHLSSSSIYPACYAPYIIVTACSDSISRFWKCEIGSDDDLSVKTYKWVE